jgi:hypothetical protein
VTLRCDAAVERGTRARHGSRRPRVPPGTRGPPRAAPRLSRAHRRRAKAFAPAPEAAPAAVAGEKDRASGGASDPRACLARIPRACWRARRPGANEADAHPRPCSAAAPPPPGRPLPNRARRRALREEYARVRLHARAQRLLPDETLDRLSHMTRDRLLCDLLRGNLQGGQRGRVADQAESAGAGDSSHRLPLHIE